MVKTIMQGTLKGTRGRVRQRKRWEDNIKGTTELGLANLSKQLKIEKGGDVLL